MRPRVRSYGESSTRTRSPGSTRMRNRRILPARCPRTSCPLSSLTRNIRFGRASVISPSNSTFSSTAIWAPPAVLTRDGRARGPRKILARCRYGRSERKIHILVDRDKYSPTGHQRDALAEDLVGIGPGGAQRRALQDAGNDDPHLLQREGGAEAAAGAAAEGQPCVGVGRVVAEEALRAEGRGIGVAVGAAVDHRDRRV